MGIAVAHKPYVNRFKTMSSVMESAYLSGQEGASLGQIYDQEGFAPTGGHAIAVADVAPQKALVQGESEHGLYNRDRRSTQEYGQDVFEANPSYPTDGAITGLGAFNFGNR